MKKKIGLLVISLLVFLMPMFVEAASGKISVTSSSTVVVGNQVKVTVTLSSSTAIGSWEIQLDYDKNYLSLVSSTAEAGGTYMVNSSSGTTSKSYTFTFKALKSGSTKVAISSYDVYAYNDMSSMSMTTTSKTITIKTQAQVEASYSSDNYLKSLSVDGYELSPTFAKDTLEYTVTTGADTTSIKIDAIKNDSKASVSGTGEFEVEEGTNKFEIVVTAQNGNTKTYIIYVEVEDEDPIAVNLNDTSMTVVKRKSSLSAPSNYEETTVNINGIEVPAFYSDTTKFTLVGLKDSGGNIYYAIYDIDLNIYTAYNEYQSNNLILYVLDVEETLKDYVKSAITIEDMEVLAYKYKEDSNFAKVYAMNVETGEYNYYSYDIKNGTFQLWNNEEVEDLQDDLKTYTYVCMLFGGALILMFLYLIVTGNQKRKLKKKITKEKANDKIYNNETIEENVNDIIETKEARKKELKKEKKDVLPSSDKNVKTKKKKNKNN